MKNLKHKHFLKLYEPIHSRFEGFCRARVYGEMDYKDLMNETLLIAYEKLDSLKNEESFLSFLFSVSVRILANDNRKKKAVTGIELESYSNDSESGTEKNAEAHLLYQALSLLSDVQKEGIILFEISGFSTKEIAAIQQVSEEAVRQRLHRGRVRLTEILTFESEYKLGKESV